MGEETVDRDLTKCKFFGETVEGLISTLLTYKVNVDDENSNKTSVTGEEIFKDYYPEKHKAILDKLVAMRKECPKEEVRRLYNILFNIIREEYGTVHEFIK